MTYRSRSQWALLILALLAAGGHVPRKLAADECADLPQSSLKLWTRSPIMPATRAEIEGMVTALAGTPSTHPLMAIIDAIDTRVAVEHRIVETPEGYCDAPEAVLL